MAEGAWWIRLAELELGRMRRLAMLRGFEALVLRGKVSLGDCGRSWTLSGGYPACQRSILVRAANAGQVSMSEVVRREDCRTRPLSPVDKRVASEAGTLPGDCGPVTLAGARGRDTSITKVEPSPIAVQGGSDPENPSELSS